MTNFEKFKQECDLVVTGEHVLTDRWIGTEYCIFDNRDADKWTIKSFIESFFATVEKWNDHIMKINGRTVTLLPLTPYNEDYDFLRSEGIYDEDLLVYDAEMSELLTHVSDDGTVKPTEWATMKYEWHTKEV